MFNDLLRATPARPAMLQSSQRSLQRSRSHAAATSTSPACPDHAPVPLLLQGIPPAPAVMFHLWHTKSYSKSYSLSWQHVDLKLKSTFFNGSADVATANKQKLTLWNDNSWGLAHHDLPEYYI